MNFNRRTRVINRILARTVEAPGPLETPCRIWTGPSSGNGRGGGYPRMSLDGFTVAVHRAMWVCVHGYLPAKKQIDHECRNRMCVEVEHLRPVTHRHNCKLRDEAARLIDADEDG